MSKPLQKRAAQNATTAQDAIDRFIDGLGPVLKPLIVSRKIRGGAYYNSLLRTRTATVEQGALYQFVAISSALPRPQVIIGEILFSISTASPPSAADVQVYREQHVCPEGCGAEGVPIAMGQVDAIKPALRAILLNNSTELDKIRSALEVQASATPALVSKPFSLLQVGQELQWIERGNCKN